MGDAEYIQIMQTSRVLRGKEEVTTSWRRTKESGRRCNQTKIPRSRNNHMLNDSCANTVNTRALNNVQFADGRAWPTISRINSIYNKKEIRAIMNKVTNTMIIIMESHPTSSYRWSFPGSPRNQNGVSSQHRVRNPTPSLSNPQRLAVTQFSTIWAK